MCIRDRLGIIRALNEAALKTTGTITFVGTVGEEGLGDLRGVKHLFATELAGQVDRFVSIDGPGLSITNGAIGSIRYRVTFRGPGGHSFGAFGLASPVHALGRFINRVSDFQVSDIPKTRSGKTAELAVRKAIHGEPIENLDALANPESLKAFSSRKELA